MSILRRCFFGMFMRSNRESCYGSTYTVGWYLLKVVDEAGTEGTQFRSANGWRKLTSKCCSTEDDVEFVPSNLEDDEPLRSWKQALHGERIVGMAEFIMFALWKERFFGCCLERYYVWRDWIYAPFLRGMSVLIVWFVW